MQASAFQREEVCPNATNQNASMVRGALGMVKLVSASACV